jgi:hypothetical protein
MGATVLCPLLEISGEGVKVVSSFDSFGIFSSATEYPTWGVLTFAIIGTVLPLINIFFYKKRKLQISIAIITALIIAIYYVTALTYLSAFLDKINDSYALNLQFGIILPVVALVFDLLAINRIKKDERLIKSLDRIR